MASPETPGKDSGTSIAALLAAADHALAREDVAEARSQAGEVLKLTEARPDGLEHARARLRLARCDLAVARVERALACALQAGAVFRLQEERVDEVGALALAARAAARAGRVVEAVESGLLAVALAESLPAGSAPAQAWCALGAAYAAGHHFASAERALRSAAEMAERCADRETLAEAAVESALAQLIRHAQARVDHDATPDAQPLLDALERCRELEVVGVDLPAALARTLDAVIALAAVLTEDVDDARRRLDLRGEPLRAGIAPHWSNALDAWTRLELAWHLQDPHGAVVHAAQIAAVAEAAQHAALRGLGHLLAADLHESRGDVASALIEWKAGARHERHTRGRDLDSRTTSTGALLAARQHQLDVATLTAKAERFQQLAYEDSLTGIANLRRFEHCLVDALVASADSGEPLCAAFIDCDRFKSVNDNFGHEVGDNALRAVAELLARGIREGDVVARLGGDEFAILFRQADLDVAREVCERIAAAIRAHDWRTLHPELRLGVSIGVEQALPGDTTRALVARADKAMFERKLQRDAAQAGVPAPLAPPAGAQLARVAQWLAGARRLVVFTGGGALPADAEADTLVLPDEADAEARAAFDAGWSRRRRALAAAEPDAGQHALAAFARTLSARAVETTFVTERIDGRLARAGALEVLELQGSALRDRCIACGAPAVGAADGDCPTCGRPAPAFRPDALLAGETPDPRVAAGAELAAKSADIVFVVDADAASFPGPALIEKARVRGARVVLLGAASPAARALADAALEGPVDALVAALQARAEAGAVAEPRFADGQSLGDEAFSAFSYLAGTGVDHRSRTLEQTLALTDTQLQQQSDVTQWQFPTPHRSPVCPEAPVVSVREYGLLAADEAVRGGMRRAFQRMLAFYGLEWQDGTVRKAAHWQQRFPVWARAAGANDLRITRILTALSLCGLRPEALALLRALEEEVPQYREGDVRKPFAFWRDAVRPRRIAGLA